MIRGRTVYRRDEEGFLSGARPEIIEQNFLEVPPQMLMRPILQALLATVAEEDDMDALELIDRRMKTGKSRGAWRAWP